MDEFSGMWFDALIFLSLDAISRYQERLWLSFIDLPSLQTTIRKALKPHMNESLNYDTHVKGNKRVAEIITSVATNFPQEFRHLLWWVNYVYNIWNRKEEDIWDTIAVKLYYGTKYQVKPYWVAARLRRLGEKVVRFNSCLRNYIHNSISRSENDDAILRWYYNSTYNNIETNLINIISTNAFVNFWNQLMGSVAIEDLEEVYTWTVENGLNDENSFPGMWKFKLGDHLLLKQ